MKVAIVVAHSSNRVIGANGRIPWKLSGDLRNFKELTDGHAVIMGRKTYESLPDAVRPLPNRVNIVVSSSLPESEEYLVARYYEEALRLAEAAQPEAERVFVIGGEAIYHMALEEADEIYLTLVEDVIDGDRRFPLLRLGVWREASSSNLFFENDLQYRFIKLERAIR